MTSVNLQQLAKHMEQAAAVYTRTPTEIAKATAGRYTLGIRAEIRSVAPGGKLSGVGSRGARVGVKYTVEPGDAHARAYVQATGPLQLIERDTKGHTIPRTQGSRRLRTAAGRLSHKREATGRSFSGVQFLGNESRHFAAMGPVHHPGTKGKHPFERGVRRVELAAITESVNALNKALRQVFKG